MALNSGKLAGKTAYISGASRGIGKAIALKLAKDGANIVIAAKTTTAHPKLPGTIYTAAKEIEEAGGKCLPCVVDIREESQVLKSVDEAVSTFGGIDILVNNASAISLTGTLETPMKKYDLMNSINARGTYLCSQACLPYLKQGKNPQILNIAPPLNMKPIWFKNHTAYTMAKYGMSMCVLGMAEEFKADGIAVNALWPKTGIATAAVEMLGGEQLMNSSRKPEIMSDAAYVILTKNSRSYTGNFAIDEDVLREVGVKDFTPYDWVPGAELFPDYFVEGAEEFFMQQGGELKKATKGQKSSGGSSSAGGVDDLFASITGLLNEEMTSKVGAVYRFVLSGDQPGNWVLDIKNGPGSVTKDAPEDIDSSCTMIMDSNDFTKMFKGELNSMQAFMSGKLKIKGDMAQALKLEKLMKTVQNKSKL
ncbi:hydroxysteroid dehydrogenase-like protein 2 [Clytia hemisphaerica]|uniref:Hydroxysteroid dehydrogenase-like protein 2 n=1 Tax=Clytia hemisphaerica TaxID=252671 RepID=A0A7M5V3Q3_9CNID|eukprot:TCONS_00031617-protein